MRPNVNTLRSELLLPMTNRGTSKEAGTQRQGLPSGLGPGRIGIPGSNIETAEAPKMEAAMAAITLPTATEHPTGRALHGTRWGRWNRTWQDYGDWGRWHWVPEHVIPTSGPASTPGTPPTTWTSSVPTTWAKGEPTAGTLTGLYDMDQIGPYYLGEGRAYFRDYDRPRNSSYYMDLYSIDGSALEWVEPK